MQPFLFVAVDPGASGGYVLRNSTGEIVDVQPLRAPEDILEVCRQMRCAGTLGRQDCAVIEKVWASPIMGVASAFAFGQNYGYWIGALLASHVPVYAVTPQAWQKGSVPGITVQGAERKKALKKAAEARYPDTRVTLATCDALLISDYVIAQMRAEKPLGEPL